MFAKHLLFVLRILTTAFMCSLSPTDLGKKTFVYGCQMLCGMLGKQLPSVQEGAQSKWKVMAVDNKYKLFFFTSQVWYGKRHNTDMKKGTSIHSHYYVYSHTMYQNNESCACSLFKMHLVYFCYYNFLFSFDCRRTCAVYMQSLWTS